MAATPLALADEELESRELEADGAQLVLARGTGVLGGQGEGGLEMADGFLVGADGHRAVRRRQQVGQRLYSLVALSPVVGELIADLLRASAVEALQHLGSPPMAGLALR